MCSAAISLYGIKTCDTCRKARRWLDSEGLAHRYHDLRIDGIDPALVRAWIRQLGVDALVNRRSATWRELAASVPDPLDESAAEALILTHPTVMKRPLIDAGGALVVGFGPPQQKAILERVRHGAC